MNASPADAVIFPVSLADAEQIADIYNHYVLHTDISFETEALTADDMRRRIADISARWPYYVLRRGDMILGYAYVHPWKERSAYSATVEATVYMRVGFCGCGLAEGLVRRVLDECPRAGVHAVIACITATNAASLRFFRHLGFSEVSRFRQVGYKHGRWLDVVDCELLL